MNTPAHLIVGAALFSREDRKGTYLSALAGGFAPDLSLYLMVAVSIWGLGVPAQIVFREYYYSDAWQSVFAVDNSFILWGGLLAFALWRNGPRLTAFAASGLAHLALDFPLHTHDARQHFWPITDWRFVSPLSYWDSNHHALIIAPLEGLFCAIAATYLLIGNHVKWLKLLILSLLIAELFVIRSWVLFF